MSTFGADDPADAKPQTGVLAFNRAVIITVDGETARMPTATDQPVELEIINGFIIKILGNRVAYIDR